jgi:5-methyltetrahydrofolate--homocysteine methyltransferase
MSAAFERQLKAVIAEGVDLICIETMTDLAEATLAIKAARSLTSTIPVAATMTFDPTERGFFTVMGVTIEQAADTLTAAGANIVGSNCGNGIDNMTAIAEEFRKHTDRPILIQSNAGLPEIVDDQIVYSETPQFMAERVPRLLASGVGIIGGCCGTTPAHITALRTAIEQHQSG